MGIGFDAQDYLRRRRRDLINHLARWIGLLLGSILLIGMAAGEEDASFTHNTFLTAGSSTESVLVAPAPASLPNTVQLPVAAQPAEIDRAQAESLARSGRVPPNTNASDSYSGSTPVTQTIAAVERETHQARPAPVNVNAPPEPTWPLPGFDLFIHLPPNAAQSDPLQVVLALHGMGGQGESFTRAMVADSDRNGWLIVAPTLPYGDYMNPTQLAEDDVRLSQMLAATLDALPRRLGLKVLPKVMVFGFSRGAQLGHRFAMFYPDHVQAVAILSAGSYTLPTREGITESGLQSLPLPYGIADVEVRLKRPLNLDLFEKIPFLIEVGAKDDRPGDVPRQFDYLDGTTRLARAKSFDRALDSLGMNCELFIAPNAGHEVNAEMLAGAIKFLRENSKPSTAR